MSVTYTVSEAAKLLKLHPKTVRRKIREGEIQSTRIGRQYRITQEQLDTFCGGITGAPEVAVTHRQVLASCVVDVDAISPDESSRISNTIMAVMNSGQVRARVDCIYYEEMGKLKVVIHGDVPETRDILSLLEQLVTTDE